MSTLTIQLPNLPPVSHVLLEDTITVGRMDGNTIVVDDSSVSMVHAKITKKNGDYYLKDLNSTNGTFVNGQSIREAKLNNSDRVRFADISGQFHADAPVVVATASIVPAAAPAAKAQAAVLQTAQPAPAAQPPPQPAAGSPAGGSAAISRRKPAKPAFNFARFATSLAPYMGGLVALAVVGALVWKLVNADRDGTVKLANVAAPTSLVPDTPAKPAAPIPPPAKSVVEKEIAAANSAAPPGDAADNVTNSLPELIKVLKDPDAAERRRAAATLHSMGSGAKPATAALRESLKDSDQDVRMWAALSLINNECYDKSAIPILVGSLGHENPVIRQVACLSLGLIPYEPAEKSDVIPALSNTASKDLDEDVRKAALSALSIIDPNSVATAGK